MGLLVELLKNGKKDEFLRLLESSTPEEINAEREDGHTLLNILIFKNFYEGVVKAVEHGADLSFSDSNHLPPFDVALLRADKRIVDYLISKGCQFSSDWHRAAYENDIETIKRSLEQYQALNVKESKYFNSQLVSPYIIAVIQDHFALVQLLFELDKFPVTEINKALICIFHKTEDLEKTPNKTADYLVENIELDFVVTLLDELSLQPYLAENQEWLLKKLLTRILSNPKERDEFLQESKTSQVVLDVDGIRQIREVRNACKEFKKVIFDILKQAVENDDYKKIKQWMDVIDKHGDVFFDPEYKFTLVHCAALYGRVELLKLLQQKGMDMAKTDINGCMPYNYAVVSKAEACQKFLEPYLPQKRSRWFPYASEFQQAIAKEDIRKIHKGSKDINNRTGALSILMAVKSNNLQVVTAVFSLFCVDRLSIKEYSAINFALQVAKKAQCSVEILQRLTEKYPKENRRPDCIIDPVFKPLHELTVSFGRILIVDAHQANNDVASSAAKKKRKKAKGKKEKAYSYHEQAVNKLRVQDYQAAVTFFSQAEKTYDNCGEKLKAAISFANVASTKHRWTESGNELGLLEKNVTDDYEAVLQRFKEILPTVLEKNKEAVQNIIVNIEQVLANHLEWEGFRAYKSCQYEQAISFFAQSGVRHQKLGNQLERAISFDNVVSLQYESLRNQYFPIDKTVIIDGYKAVLDLYQGLKLGLELNKDDAEFVEKRIYNITRFLEELQLNSEQSYVSQLAMHRI